MKGVKKQINLEIPSDKAFQIFVNELNEWWPREYTWSKDKLIEIKIEGSVGGLCTEIGPYRFRCDWGRVTEFVKNRKISLKWQIGKNREPVPDPMHASDLMLEFNGDADRSTLILEHRNFENHGEGSEEYKLMMNSEKGWEYLLSCYKQFCLKK